MHITSSRPFRWYEMDNNGAHGLGGLWQGHIQTKLMSNLLDWLSTSCIPMIKIVDFCFEILRYFEMTIVHEII
jgi:hypothetical protein